MKPLLLLALVATAAVAAERSLPNVVILYADDMGWGDLGVQNPDSKIPTPNLDRLAAEGTRFTNAHSSSGVCTPSRYALLHGRYHWRKFHGIVNAFDPPILDPERLTLAELLKAKGYRTACIGKWHLGWDWQAIRRPGATPALDKKGRTKVFAPDAFDWSQPVPGGPLDHGFDHYFGDDVPNFPPYAWIENDRLLAAPTEPLNITPKTAEGSWEARPGPMVAGWDFYAVVPRLAERAEEWVRAQRGREGPFFLYAPFNSPHAPIVPSAEFTGTSKAGGFGDFMAQTDAAAGRILRALEEIDAADNTLVVFTADNGAESYAYERVRAFGHRSSGPFRGVKRDLWEGGHRVPFVVRWPGIVPAGRVSDALISQIDLFATIATAVGASIPAGSAEDSHDQTPLLRGGEISARASLVHNTNEKGYAVRMGDWVLIDAPTGAVSKVPAWFDAENGYTKHDQPGELYNLREDPGQKRNLYAEQPAKVAELRAELQRIRANGEVRPLAP